VNLIIDIGNTQAKVTVSDSTNLYDEYTVVELTVDFLQGLIEEHKVKNSIISSVKKDDLEIESFLEQATHFIKFDSSTPVPVLNKYRTPETLGRDRLAAVVGANYLYPKSNCLVIDSGTAITYDFINASGDYEGGNIAPGLTMRYRALNKFTDKLPLLSANDFFSLLGDSTDSAIINGVQNGMIFELKGYIEAFKLNYDNLKVILTGGDAIFFDKKINNDIFVVSNLVLIGLNRILNYNVDEEI